MCFVCVVVRTRGVWYVDLAERQIRARLRYAHAPTRRCVAGPSKRGSCRSGCRASRTRASFSRACRSRCSAGGRRRPRRLHRFVNVLLMLWHRGLMSVGVATARQGDAVGDGAPRAATTVFADGEPSSSRRQLTMLSNHGTRRIGVSSAGRRCAISDSQFPPKGGKPPEAAAPRRRRGGIPPEAGGIPAGGGRIPRERDSVEISDTFASFWAARSKFFLALRAPSASGSGARLGNLHPRAKPSRTTRGDA